VPTWHSVAQGGGSAWVVVLSGRVPTEGSREVIQRLAVSRQKAQAFEFGAGSRFVPLAVASMRDGASRTSTRTSRAALRLPCRACARRQSRELMVKGSRQMMRTRSA
jgi:hypothetical protein